jgi:tripartite-type tricarboxylate transporter receptor subunit TctC
MTDLMANHVPAAGMTLASIRGVLDGNKVRPLAVSSSRRLAAFPDIPTFAEAGFPKLTGSSWFGVSGPPGMAPGLVERINSEFNRALTNPAVSKMFNDRSFETDTMTSAQFTKFFLEEIALLAPYLKGK